VGSGVTLAGPLAGVADVVGAAPGIVGSTTAVAGCRALGGSYRPLRSNEQVAQAGSKVLSS
jgi:hypothetical protein